MTTDAGLPNLSLRLAPDAEQLAGSTDGKDDRSVARMMLPILDRQLPHVHGSVCAAAGCMWAMWSDEIDGGEKPSQELIGLRWALEEARDGLEELRKDLQAVLDRAREEGGRTAG